MKLCESRNLEAYSVFSILKIHEQIDQIDFGSSRFPVWYFDPSSNFLLLWDKLVAKKGSFFPSKASKCEVGSGTLEWIAKMSRKVYKKFTNLQKFSVNINIKLFFPSSSWRNKLTEKVDGKMIIRIHLLFRQDKSALLIIQKQILIKALSSLLGNENSWLKLTEK